MRTVETFKMGSVMTTGGQEEIVAVAHDGVFSHAHYFRRYPDGDHRDLYCRIYSDPQSIAEEVRKFCGWKGKGREEALKRVGCA